MDSTLIPVILAVVGSITSLGVAIVGSRKTRAEAHAETSEVKAALQEGVIELRGLLAESKTEHLDCRKQIAEMRVEARRQSKLIGIMQDNIDLLRRGEKTDWSGLDDSHG